LSITKDGAAKDYLGIRIGHVETADVGSFLALIDKQIAKVGIGAS
jgi:hypothetical protein